MNDSINNRRESVKKKKWNWHLLEFTYDVLFSNYFPRVAEIKCYYNIINCEIQFTGRKPKPEIPGTHAIDELCQKGFFHLRREDGGGARMRRIETVWRTRRFGGTLISPKRCQNMSRFSLFTMIRATIKYLKKKIKIK